MYQSDTRDVGLTLIIMATLLVSIIGLIIGGAVYAGTKITASVPVNKCNACLEACKSK